MRFKPRSIPIRKSARRSPIRRRPRKSAMQAEGLWYPRISVEGSAGVRKLAQPDAPRPRHRRQDALAARRPSDRSTSCCSTAAGARPRSAARPRAPTPPRRGSRSAANSSRSTSPAPTSTICCSSGWSRSRRTMRPSTSGSPATFAKAWRRARSAIADQQQAEERLQSARARVTEAREDLDTAAIAVPDLDRHADRQRVDAARPVAVYAGDAGRGRGAGARQQSARPGSARRSVDVARR